MSTSRRNFLKSGTLVALSAGVPLVSMKSVLGHDPTGASSDLLSMKSFADQINTYFTIHHGRSKVSAKLVDVKALPAPSAHGEAFSLFFRGHNSRALKQNTYVIEHAKMGSFSFLLVPMRTSESAPLYEAVINRLSA